MKKLVLFLALLPALIFAADQKFTFALPDMDGRICLGVFTTHGKLVRTLAVGATTADFTVGLNGLITTWDGKNEQGVPVPPGKYHVRGYVVGDAVKAEGEAYHFNDWIEDEKSPRILRITDFQRVEGGLVLLAQEAFEAHSEEVVVRYDFEKGVLWSAQPTVSEQGTASLDGFRGIALSDGVVAMRTPSRFDTFDLATGQPLKSVDFPYAANSLAACNKTLYLGSLSTIQKFSLPELTSTGEESHPDQGGALAVAPDKKIVGSVSVVSLSLNGQKWTSIPTGVVAASISFGLKDTFWLAGKEQQGGGALVGQYNFQGELLRAYRSDFAPLQVRASTDSEAVSVLEEKAPTQRLRQMRLVDRPGGGTEWEINFEKAVTKCSNFGVVDGALVADSGTSPQRTTMEFPLATGGLTATPPKLSVQLACDATGLWLKAASGLKLTRLADQLHADRFVLVPGEKTSSMTAYAGDGAVVAEYLVTGLDAIAEIDAGEIEIP